MRVKQQFFVDIRDYGARVTAADNKTAIDAAIAALDANYPSVLFIPPGKWITSGGHDTGAKPVTVQGAGPGASVLYLKDNAGAGAGADVLTINGQQATVRELQIDGNYPSNATRSRCLVVKNTKVRLSNLWLVNALQEGLLIQGTAGQTAHAVIGERVFVYGCQGSGGTASVRFADYAYDAQFTNLWVGGNPAAKGNIGILLNALAGGTQPSEVTLVAAHVWGHASDGVQSRADLLRLEASYVETNTGHGVNLTSCNRCSVVGCHLWKNGGNGVYIFNGGRHAVTSNIIGENTLDGVRGDGSAALVRVADNDFSAGGGQDYAVHTIVTTTTDKWIISGNTALSADHSLPRSAQPGTSGTAGTNAIFTETGANHVIANNIQA